MDSNILAFVVAAKDNASATLGRVGKELRAVGGAGGAASGPLARLSTVTGGFVNPATLAIGAALGLGAAIVGAAKASAEEQVGIARLNTALAANVAGYAGNRDAIEALIAKRELLAFSDDEQRKSLSLLLTRTHDVGKAQELLGTAMDFARLKGKTLEESTTILAKVYGGNTSILQRHGFAIEKGTTATEALAIVQKAAAGQAEAYGSTLAGSTEAAGIAFGDLVEDIGSFLLPILTSLAKWITGSLIPAIRLIATVIGVPVGVIGNLIGIVLNLVNIALQPLFFMLGRVGDGLSFLGKVLVGPFTAAWEFAQQVVGDVLASIIGAAKNIIGVAASIPGPWQDAAKDMKASLAEAQASVDAWGQNTKTKTGAAAGAVADYANSAVGSMQGATPWIESEAGEQGDAIFTGVDAGATKAIAAVAKLPGEMADALRSGRESWKTSLSTLSTDLSNEMTLAQRIAELQAALVGTDLVKGLASTDPVVHAQAVASRGLIEAQLRIEYGASWGFNIGSSWGKGMVSGVYSQLERLRMALVPYYNLLQGMSPPKEGPLKNVDVGGFNIGKAWGTGLSKGIRSGAHGLLDGFANLGLAPSQLAYAGGGSSSMAGSVTINVNAPLGTPAAGQALAYAIMPELMREMRRQSL